MRPVPAVVRRGELFRLFATVTNIELSRGYNMALVTEGPVAKQAKALYAAVVAKNKYYHDEIFRGIVLNGQVSGGTSVCRRRPRRMSWATSATSAVCSAV